MPILNQTGPSYNVFGQLYPVYRIYRAWEHSPRVNGELALRGNAMNTQSYKLSVKRGRQTYSGIMIPPATVPPYPIQQKSYWTSSAFRGPNLQPVIDRLLSRTYGSFRKKLYVGNANLGVTIGSYKQTAEMVASRFQQLKRPWDTIADSLESLQRRGRFTRLTQSVSNQHLEVIFGMIPLYQDIQASLMTVCQQSAVRETVTSRQSASDSVSWSFNTDPYGNYVRHALRFDYKLHVTRAAQVRIDNPNLWLAERAGLLNPAAVAWDLVPWSWVVGMFGNFGQLVNSVTDFAGLSFDNDTTTIAVAGRLRIETRSRNVSDPTYQLHNNFEYEIREKYRTRGAVARPPLIARLPNLSWGLAATAASLVGQRINRVIRLLN